MTKEQDYKNKSLYHLKNKLNDEFIVQKSIHGHFKGRLELIFFGEQTAIFVNWEECYRYLKEFTKTNKRRWIERFVNQDNTIWDTDLEPEEQDCVDYLLEYFDYQQGSFEIEELREILVENTGEENTTNACDILIKALIKNDKEVIEVE
jgi:hypothetical protein